MLQTSCEKDSMCSALPNAAITPAVSDESRNSELLSTHGHVLARLTFRLTSRRYIIITYSCSAIQSIDPRGWHWRLIAIRSREDPLTCARLCPPFLQVQYIEAVLRLEHGLSDGIFFQLLPFLSWPWTWQGYLKQEWKNERINCIESVSIIPLRDLSSSIGREPLDRVDEQE